MSMSAARAGMSEPSFVLPLRYQNEGTRVPPSQREFLVPFMLALKGTRVSPFILTRAMDMPLSVMKMTMVFSSWFHSSSFFMRIPKLVSMFSIMP